MVFHEVHVEVVLVALELRVVVVVLCSVPSQEIDGVLLEVYRDFGTAILGFSYGNPTHGFSKMLLNDRTKRREKTNATACDLLVLNDDFVEEDEATGIFIT